MSNTSGSVSEQLRKHNLSKSNSPVSNAKKMKTNPSSQANFNIELPRSSQMSPETQIRTLIPNTTIQKSNKINNKINKITKQNKNQQNGFTKNPNKLQKKHKPKKHEKHKTQYYKNIKSNTKSKKNTSISTNQYPKTLKKSKVLPLIKNATPPKSPSDPASYRGINIIMTIGKIIDKVVLQQVLEYLTKNKIIHQAHHGAISGKSTTTAIAPLLPKIWIRKITTQNVQNA